MDLKEKKKAFKRITIAKLCPKCENLSHIEADFCRYCGAKLTEKGIICPRCSKYINDKNADSCPFCSESFNEKGVICPYCSEFTHIESQEKETFCEQCGERIKNLSDKVKVKVSRISESLD
ncbi:MAG: hypothetical protein EU541_02215 [Promethearchaeota archaeon]|nr:MAG: hypothetical protein EU541_02215 [Candidatus Lokiarchaeota archaeon]